MFKLCVFYHFHRRLDASCHANGYPAHQSPGGQSKLIAHSACSCVMFGTVYRFCRVRPQSSPCESMSIIQNTCESMRPLANRGLSVRTMCILPLSCESLRVLRYRSRFSPASVTTIPFLFACAMSKLRILQAAYSARKWASYEANRRMSEMRVRVWAEGCRHFYIM